MYITFENINSDARVWIYQSAAELNSEQISEISEFLVPNIEEWSSHGAPLKGSFSFFFNRFLVIAADTNFNTTSGCSIDTSSRWIKQINTDFRLDFFDRSQGYFENEELKFFPILEAKKFVSLGIITSDTIILNNQISKKNDLATNWKVKASESIFKRYFQNSLA
jgi:hypothetical protein